MNDHPIQGLADMLGKMAPLSETARQWEAEQWMLRNDPVLAKLLRAEAIAGHRAESNVCEASKLPMIRDLLREAIAAHTKRPFRNPLFPERS